MQWIGLFLVLFTAAVHSRSYGIGDPLFGHRIIVSFAEQCDHHLCMDLGDEPTGEPVLYTGEKRTLAQVPLTCQSGTASRLFFLRCAFLRAASFFCLVLLLLLLPLLPPNSSMN